MPADREMTSAVACMAVSTRSTGMPVSSLSSAAVGSRPSSLSRVPDAFDSVDRVSTTWDGRRMVRPLSAMPRPMAWRIHHVA